MADVESQAESPAYFDRDGTLKSRRATSGNVKTSKSDGTSSGRLLLIPLNFLLLAISIVAASTIVVPLAAITYSASYQSVNEILIVLRNNYAIQVADVVNKHINDLQAMFSNMNQNLDIQNVLKLPTINNLNLTEQTRLMFAYSSILEPHSSIFSGGWLDSAGKHTLFIGNINRTGLYCNYYINPETTACEHLIVTSLNLEKQEAAIIRQPRYENPMRAPATFLGGRWDGDPMFLNLGGPQPSALYGIRWSQWPGVPLTEKGVGEPTGAHSITQNLMEFSAELKVGFGDAGVIKFQPAVTFSADVLENQHLVTMANTVIAIWNQNGVIIATNGDHPGVLYNTGPGGSYTTVKADENANEYIKLGAQEARKINGGWNLAAPLSLDRKAADGEKLFLELRSIKADGASSWTALIAIPERSLLGTMRESAKKVTIISTVLAIAMLTLAAATSVLVTRPLRNLTQSMQQATQMDFSSLKDMKTKSIIKEVNIMQEVFGTMLARFASAIKDNRKLASRNSVSRPGTAARGTPHAQDVGHISE